MRLVLLCNLLCCHLDHPYSTSLCLERERDLSLIAKSNNIIKLTTLSKTEDQSRNVGLVYVPAQKNVGFLYLACDLGRGAPVLI
jgi:hypothetical protein